MPVTMRTLRWLVVVVALVLVGSVAAFLGVARRSATNYIKGLPKRLGVNIKQETDHYTYSQTLAGKTVFTIRAAKAIQRTDGIVVLKDVGMVIYGRSGDRADRVRGQEFEYDVKGGILRAVGEALIDLGPPGAKAKDADDSKMIHVRTNGLVFMQKQQIASTAGELQFVANGLSGTAVGAAYDSGTGVLVLKSQVRVSGLRGAEGQERPLLLTAARAEMDRAGNVVKLEEAKYVSASERGSRTISASRALVTTDAEGKPQEVHAQGHVVLSAEGQGTISAERMDLGLSASGQPRDGHLYGGSRDAGVRFRNDLPLRQEEGVGRDVKVAFDAEGRPLHVLATGAVEMNEKSGLSVRKLTGERVDLTLDGGGKQRISLRAAVATGATGRSGGDGARLRIVDARPGGNTATAVRGDTLTGRFGAAGLTGLDGTGKTSVERLTYDAGGAQLTREVSTGDLLAIDLQPAVPGVLKPKQAGARKVAPGQGRLALERATQRGAVEILRETAAKKAGGALEVEHARGAQAVYEAASDRMTVTGGAQVADATGNVIADTIELDRATGNAVAEGAVKAGYLDPKGGAGAEPVHVLAAKAVSVKATGVTEFTAAAGGKVRMWQGGSQIEAPVIDLDRTKKTVAARGGGSGVEAEVRTLLVSEPVKGKPASAPVRVLSRTLIYTDATRQADFAGRVVVTARDAVLRAREAVVYLLPASAKSGLKPDAGANAAEGMLGGKVDRIVAQGELEMEEPGRRASGEKLVFKASDETYTLTGTKAAPPRMSDETRGNVTGTELRFKRGNDSVEVLGGDGVRVRSEPRVSQ